MMKHICLILTALLLMMNISLAEEVTAVSVPTEMIPREDGMLEMMDALIRAKEVIGDLPEHCMSRAALVRMSDGSVRWIVSIFEMTNMTDAWCVSMDAVTGGDAVVDFTDAGFFLATEECWVQAKGLRCLWSLEDKLLFDMLYHLTPTCGLPVEGDLSREDALQRAAEVLGLSDVTPYQIGYGYLMGSDNSGMWEVCFVQDGACVYQVNMDAATGDILMISPDEQGNG